MDDQAVTTNTTDRTHFIKDRGVIALFENEDDARNAEQALIEAGFEEVNVAWNGEEVTDPHGIGSPDGFWKSVKAFFGDNEDGQLLGEGIRRGQTLVTVHTPQEHHAAVDRLLKPFNPTDLQEAKQKWSGQG